MSMSSYLKGAICTRMVTASYLPRAGRTGLCGSGCAAAHSVDSRIFVLVLALIVLEWKELIDDDALNEVRAFANPLGPEFCLLNQLAEYRHVAFRGKDNIDPSAGRQSFADLLKQRGDIAEVSPGAPSPICDVAWLAFEERGICQDHIKSILGRERRQH